MFEGDTRDNIQIIQYLYKQFIINKTPKCMSLAGFCRYSPQGEGQIGCAVGCLLPPEAAVRRDKESVGGLNEIILNTPHISTLYDECFNRDQLPFLMACQKWHDYHLGDGGLHIGLEHSKSVLIGIAISFNIHTAWLSSQI